MPKQKKSKWNNGGGGASMPLASLLLRTFLEDRLEMPRLNVWRPNPFLHILSRIYNKSFL